MNRSGTERKSVTLLAILGCGAVLRLLNAGALFTNDEAISALAARSIAQTGLPVLPSGALYLRDPLYHFLTGGAFALPVPDVLSAKALSLAFSLLAIYGTYRLALALFDSEPLALTAAMLIAVDPFSASYGSRVRMYAALQALAVWAVFFFERGFVPRRSAPRAAPRRSDGIPAERWRLAALLVLAAAVLTQRVALFLLPALAFVWLAEGGYADRRFGWLLPAGALAALVYMMPALLWKLYVPAGVAATPGVTLYAPDVVEYGGASYGEILRLKLPGRPASALRTLLFLGGAALAALGLLRESGSRRPGARLLAYLVVPAALIVLYPSFFFDLRYLMHLLPFAAILFAAGAAAWAGSLSRAPRLSLLLAASGASACFLLVETPLWQLRYPAFLLPLAAGAAAFVRESGARRAEARRDPRAVRRRALGAFSLPLAAVAFVLPLTGAALWWIAVLPFAPALRYAQARHQPRDAVLADGHVPLVAWSLGDADFAIPNYSLNVYRVGERTLGDLYTGAPPLESVEQLAQLAAASRVWYFDFLPRQFGGREEAYFRAKVEPLRAYAAAHFRTAVACRQVTLYDSRPSFPPTAPQGCDLEPRPEAVKPQAAALTSSQPTLRW
jgi:hypothetical protein